MTTWKAVKRTRHVPFQFLCLSASEHRKVAHAIKRLERKLRLRGHTIALDSGGGALNA